MLVIVLIIFGPKRLPELGRSLGRGIREFRGSISGEHGNDDDEDSPAELDRGEAAAAKPDRAAAAKPDQPAEAVEGEVVTEKRA